MSRRFLKNLENEVKSRKQHLNYSTYCTLRFAWRQIMSSTLIDIFPFQLVNTKKLSRINFISDGGNINMDKYTA